MTTTLTHIASYAALIGVAALIAYDSGEAYALMFLWGAIFAHLSTVAMFLLETHRLNRRAERVSIIAGERLAAQKAEFNKLSDGVA